ncbi:MAG: ABC transporter permease [Pseudomonadales bacterium]
MSWFGLVWSNLFRHRVRTGLTLLSVLVAFLLFALLRNVIESFSGGLEVAGVDRLVTSPKYSIIDPLPLAHLNQIAAVDGVAAVTHANWFGGYYQENSNFFPKYPVEPREWFSMYPEYRIAPEQLEAFANTRTGAVVPASLAEEYGWSVGDRIPITADIYPRRDGSRLWEFDLVGTYTGPPGESEPVTFLFQYDYFDEAAQFGSGTVGWFVVRVVDPDAAAEVASRIDAAFENSLNPTRTSTEAEYQRQFASQIGDIGLMMSGILGAVFFTILLLTGNTMAQGLRERIPELAVLKTLGFSDTGVSLLVLAEAVLLFVVGGALGLGLGALATVALAPTLETVTGVFQLSWTTVALGFALAGLLGLAVGAVPALAARRLTIVDALREQ